MTSGCLRGNQKGCEAGKGASSGIGAPSPGLEAPSGGMRVPGPAATTLAESIRATTLRPSRPLPSTHTRLQDDHTTSSSNLGERLRHEENATPGRGTDREPSGVSVRAERPSLARATRSTRIRQALANNGDIPRGRVRVVPGGVIRRRRGQQSRPRTRHLSPAAKKCPRPQYGKASTRILLTLMVVNCHQIDRGCQKWMMQPQLPHGRASPGRPCPGAPGMALLSALGSALVCHAPTTRPSYRMSPTPPSSSPPRSWHVKQLRCRLSRASIRRQPAPCFPSHPCFCAASRARPRALSA